MYKSLHLYYNTLRHLKTWQIAGRLYSKAKRAMGATKVPVPPQMLEQRLSIKHPFPHHDPWNSREAIKNGTFCFLDESHTFPDGIQWDTPSLPLLWRFNLHYFHYLFLLDTKEQVAICKDWIHKNPTTQVVAWHPYPTALRIVNWCKSAFDDAVILESLYRQAAFLYRNLETYIYGNHLLENARALVVAGSFFGDQGEAPAWRRKGLDLYLRETPEQILPDGGHYERSPMYHALMLEGFLDVLNCITPQTEGYDNLLDTSKRMTDVLFSLQRPDGSFPLFNDATHEIAHPVHTLLAYGQAITGHTLYG